MARPRTNRPADSFTSTENSVSAGLPPRTWELLMRHGLAPEMAPASEPNFNVWDTNGFKHGALIGAFVGANIPVLAAARLARAVNTEIRQRYYVLRSNLERYLEKDHNPKHPWHPFDKSVEESLGCKLPSEDEAFWLHHLLSGTDIYRRNEAMPGDFCIEIADKTYVYLTCVGALPALSPFTGEKSYLDPNWRIVGWDRGNEEPAIHHIMDELQKDYWEQGTPAWHHARAVEEEYLHAHRNAVSLVRINISAAIRKAFDRLHDHRSTGKATVDFSTTIKVPPGRYHGCDIHGYPLDPQHPYNRDLPPAQRRKRLAEIEAYIDERDAKRAAEDAE
jgi:hypothetical protein